MCMQIAGAAVNIALDWLLIFGNGNLPSLGIVGRLQKIRLYATVRFRQCVHLARLLVAMPLTARLGMAFCGIAGIWWAMVFVDVAT